ncbi:uncharacterized protein EV420DRAFT_1487302 [Desarmillaria tabescens]|uniref:ATP-dependent DNA helicase n=1 Tax=Armillaria tabescens TaxID=1929756 RepID=A0AA39J7B4_ARMTA|nr:uncharacterized protein EV420DRAFT_1487302 [Desarmillaria tabescens]KAK0436979.1 hypothetical protein EV420DRAFT_1487302 [Desarmillaria tabescens]
MQPSCIQQTIRELAARESAGGRKRKATSNCTIWKKQRKLDAGEHENRGETDEQIRRRLDVPMDMPVDMAITLQMDRMNCQLESRSESQLMNLDEEDEQTVRKLIDGPFLSNASVDTRKGCIERYIKRTSNAELAQGTVADLTLSRLLVPSRPHPKHTLFNGALLHEEAITDGSGYACKECLQHLQADQVPPLSLANNMWRGKIPLELSILNLAERILVAKHLPCTYLVKLYPKAEHAEHWLSEGAMYMGLKGNISSFPLNPSHIAGLVSTNVSPPQVKILAAVIGITFVMPRGFKMRELPKMFHVRREIVRHVLLWLKENNPLYSDIIVSDDALVELPADGVLEEILSNVCTSNDMAGLAVEQDSYIPDQDSWDFFAQEPSFAPISGAGTGPEPFTEPDTFLLHANGIIDVNGNDITDTDIMVHALANLGEVARLSMNMQEQIKKQEKERTVGQKIQTIYWVLFPGYFPTDVEGSKWIGTELYLMKYTRDGHYNMRIADSEKTTTSSSRSSFIKNRAAIMSLTPETLKKASEEEAHRVPFSHPGVRALRKQLSAVRVCVPGTDKSRRSIRSKIWSMNLVFNLPSLWITINPSDMHNPIAQVLAGENIDLDHFVKTAGPNLEDRGLNMASDPFAATQYFHLVISIVLQELFGIKGATSGSFMSRKEEIFGLVNAYIGAVEAQGQGTLHLHILLWLKGAPSSKTMMQALLSDAFREKMKTFIRANITADLNGACSEEIENMAKGTAISYAQPIHPSEPGYESRKTEALMTVARTVQYHKCKVDAWVLPTGEWGPKRLSSKMVAWCPKLMECLKSNQDIKVITNAVDTKDITWYITNYTTKKQVLTWNTSAALACTLAFEMEADKRTIECRDLGKKLIQKFAHAMNKEQEFSVCEAISQVMGWEDRSYTEELARDSNGMLVQSQSDEVTMPIEFVGREVRLKDQLREYSDRGDALEHVAFMDFFSKTYDGEPPKGKTGTWFPRSNRHDCREYYCASMLALFMPWRSMKDLKNEGEHFEDAWHRFSVNLTPKQVDAIKNIQYFHEASDHAHRDKSSTASGALLNLDNEQCPSQDDSILWGGEGELEGGYGHSEYTEADIKIAETLRHPMREVQFRINAMERAVDCGIFNMPTVYTALPAVAPIADADDILQFWEWNKLLKSITRDKEKDRRHGTEDRRAELLWTMEHLHSEVSEPGGSRDVPKRQLQGRPLLQLLNEEQKRAHDIIESHLKAFLSGKNPRPLHMLVQGQGGTGKTVLINAISETFLYYDAENLLAKTATSGVAASLIGGQTLHSFAGIPINPGKSDDWYDKSSKETTRK